MASTIPKRAMHFFTALFYLPSEHVLRVDSLPQLHKDPFDRILIAQARSEGMILITVDYAVIEYGDPVRAV